MAQSRCRYTNNSTGFQILVIGGIEKIIYPGDSLEFEASIKDRVVIKDKHVTATNADTIPCQQLLII